MMNPNIVNIGFYTQNLTFLACLSYPHLHFHSNTHNTFSLLPIYTFLFIIFLTHRHIVTYSHSHFHTFILTHIHCRSRSHTLSFILSHTHSHSHSNTFSLSHSNTYKKPYNKCKGDHLSFWKGISDPRCHIKIIKL